MEKYLKEIIILFMQLLDFYISPLTIIETIEVFGFYIFVIITAPIYSLILGIISNNKIKYLYSVVLGILLIPALFINAELYNIGLIELVLIGSIIGLVIGSLINFVIKKIKKVV